MHVTRAPELREAILSGRFQRFVCTHCGRVVVVEPTLLYTDFERNQWIGVFPTHALPFHRELSAEIMTSFHRNMEVAAPEIVRQWAPSFRIRCVFGLPALREKLILWEEGLDDALFECMKLQLLLSLDPELLDHRTQVWLLDQTSEHFIFSVTPPSKEQDGSVVEQHLRLHRDRYLSLQKKRFELSTSFRDLFEGILVDWRGMFCPEQPLPKGAPPLDPYPWASP